jgi:rhodanese-related sulfurtransferase
MPVEIDRREVQRLMRAGAQIVEVLPAEQFEAEHLPGAISLPLKRLDALAAGRLDRGRAVVVYCYDMQ